MYWNPSANAWAELGYPMPDPAPNKPAPKCDCGGAKLREPSHSHWCSTQAPQPTEPSEFYNDCF